MPPLLTTASAVPWEFDHVSQVQCSVFGTGFAGDIGRARGGGDHHLVFFLDDGCERQSHAARRDIDDEVDVLGVEPAPGNRRGVVGLVLGIGGHDLDRDRFIRGAEILDRHFDRVERTRAREVGIGTGHVAHHTNLH